MKNIVIKFLFVVFFLNSCTSSQKLDHDQCDQSNFAREPNAVRCESLWKGKKSSKTLDEDGVIEQKRPITVPVADIDKQLQENYESSNIKALAKWNGLRTQSADINGREVLHKQIRRLLSDESLSTYHIFLAEAIDFANSYRSMPSTSKEGDFDFLKQGLYSVLKKMLPEKMAKERSELILKEKLTYNDLLLALGKLTHKQSLEALVGKKGINNIDPESLIGQYISQSAQKYNIKVATLVDSFKEGPGYTGRGPDKLYIAVGQSNYDLIENMLMDPHHLFHDYSLGQGTLQMAHSKKGISYAGYNNSPGASFSPGKLLPLINLSSVEASNTVNYFTLGSSYMGGGKKFSKLPWGYQKVDPNNPQKMESYCKSGGYTCCTHWIGEAPLGEKFVDEYSFPGVVDSYANAIDRNTGVTGEVGSALRSGPVGGFTHFQSNSGLEEIGTVTRRDRLARIVWTESQGRQQLWDMVDDKGADALSKAEWVNPGWVLYSFLTRTSQLKVPIVFVMKADPSQLNRQYLDGLTSSISYY